MLGPFPKFSWTAWTFCVHHESQFTRRLLGWWRSKAQRGEMSDLSCFPEPVVILKILGFRFPWFVSTSFVRFLPQRHHHHHLHCHPLLPWSPLVFNLVFLDWKLDGHERRTCESFASKALILRLSTLPLHWLLVVGLVLPLNPPSPPPPYFSSLVPKVNRVAQIVVFRRWNQLTLNISGRNMDPLFRYFRRTRVYKWRSKQALWMVEIVFQLQTDFPLLPIQVLELCLWSECRLCVFIGALQAQRWGLLIKIGREVGCRLPPNWRFRGGEEGSKSYSRGWERNVSSFHQL